jgi:O-antigen/teichoic acid export membrane protein
VVSLARSVVKGSALGLLVSALAVPVVFVSTPLFLDGLGPAAYGYWFILQSIFSGLNLLMVGTAEATTYFVARDDSEAAGPEARSRNRALFLVVLCGCAAGVLILALGPGYGLSALLRLPPLERPAFDRLLAPAAALWAFQFWCNWLWVLPRARHEYGVLFLNQAALTVAAPLLGWAGMRLGGGDAAYFLAGQALAWAGGSLSLHGWNFRHKTPLDLRPGFDAQVLAEVGRYARWAFVFNLSVMVLLSSDRLLLASLGAAALTGYSIASSLTQRVYAVTGTLINSLVPAMARIKEGLELERLRRGFSVSLRAVGFFWAAMLLPLAAWGDHFMAVWLGKPELAAATYGSLLLLCCGAFLGSLAAACHVALMGSGRPRLAALTGLAGAGLGLVVAVPAISRFGVPGAACLGLAGNAAAYLSRVLFMEKFRFKRPLGPLLAEMALAFAALAAAWAGLRAAAPALAGAGRTLTIAAMLAAAGLILLAGLGLDSLLSGHRGRPSLLATLAGLRAGGPA